jgi:hypothetical protein
MKRELIENLLNSYLKDYKYRIKKYDFYEESFGDFIIILKSIKGIPIKLIRDKGQLFCEVNKFFSWIDINNFSDSNRVFDMNEKAELAISLIFKYLNDNMNKIKAQLI